jgi:hypothetical protein
MERDLDRLRQVLRRARVLDLKALGARFQTRSRRSLFRDLVAVGYRTSYTHGGRYYTLADLPAFDDWGLWFHGDIGFSRAGTLKETAARQVQEAPDGRTHAELSGLLRVRVHNTLLDLVRQRRLGREPSRGTLLYVSAEPERAAEQLRRRQDADRMLAEARRVPTVEETVEILAEALRGAAAIPTPLEVARRLAARGVTVEPCHVQQVFAAHGLQPGKKTAPPP